jgi:apolipoprotein N-acyltransferase
MTGITAVLHASGDVAFETGVHERRADRVDIPVRAGVFSLYASVGDVFAWACVLAVAAVLVGGAIGQRRGKKSRSTTTG